MTYSDTYMAFAVFAWVATFGGVLLVTALLFQPWKVLRQQPPTEPQKLTVPAALAALLSLVPFELVKCYAARAAGGNIFGLMRLGYMDAVVAIPAIGLVILILARGRRWQASRGLKILAALALLPAPIGAYATLVETRRLQLETASVPVSAAHVGHDPITVGVLADIQTDHVGDYEVAAVDWLMQQNPDLIVINGDLWQGRFKDGMPTEAAELRSLMTRLSAPAGVYFMPGNLEYSWNPRPLFLGGPVRYLANEVVHLRIRDRELTLAGMDSLDLPGCQKVVRELEKNKSGRDIRLIVGHYPDTILSLSPKLPIDLYVAGHTHGGQIVLPFFGPLVTFSSVPRAIAAGGLHDLNGRKIYVSRGVGHERGQAPRLRLFCPPEITLLTLTAP